MTPGRPLWTGRHLYCTRPCRTEPPHCVSFTITSCLCFRCMQYTVPLTCTSHTIYELISCFLCFLSLYDQYNEQKTVTLLNREEQSASFHYWSRLITGAQHKIAAFYVKSEHWQKWQSDKLLCNRLKHLRIYLCIWIPYKRRQHCQRTHICHVQLFNLLRFICQFHGRALPK